MVIHLHLPWIKPPFTFENLGLGHLALEDYSAEQMIQKLKKN